jgi:hypothetical protein
LSTPVRANTNSYPAHAEAGCGAGHSEAAKVSGPGTKRFAVTQQGRVSVGRVLAAAINAETNPEALPEARYIGQGPGLSVNRSGWFAAPFPRPSASKVDSISPQAGIDRFRWCRHLNGHPERLPSPRRPARAAPRPCRHQMHTRCTPDAHRMHTGCTPEKLLCIRCTSGVPPVYISRNPRRLPAVQAGWFLGRSQATEAMPCHSRVCAQRDAPGLPHAAVTMCAAPGLILQRCRLAHELCPGELNIAK